MSCRYEEQVALWAGGDLTVRESAAVEAHLKECAGCGELAGELGGMIVLLREAGDEEPPEDSLTRVRGRVLRGVAARRARWRWGAAAAVLLVGMAGAWWNSRVIEVAGPPTLATVREALTTPEVPAVKKRAAPPVESVRVETVAPRRTEPVLTERAELARVEEPTAAEPMVVKLLTDDPEVVIYWIVEETGG